MPEARGNGGDSSISVSMDGEHLRVDARPARLVTMVRSASGDAPPAFTAKRADGSSTTQAVPAGARQVTFLVADSLSVEATPGSDFVGLAEESGRRLVVAFNGEVTVLPSGPDGDRFALGAHEALLVPAGGGEARVVPVDDLSDDEQDEISAVLESAALAGAVSSSPSSVDEPTQELTAVGADDATDADDDKSADDDAATGTAAAATAAAATAAAAASAKKVGGAAKAGGAAKKGSQPAKASGSAQKRAKKGKRGRPQQQAKKAAPTATTSGAGVRKAAPVAAAAGAAGAAKKTTTPAKKSTAVSNKAAATAVHDESYEDTPSDRRFVIGAIALAAVIAIVLAVFFLTNDDGDDTDLAADGSSTTEATTTTEEATTTTEASATTTTAAAAAATTTAAPATTTTAAPATTTTAAPTTTTTAAAKYAITPKSCVQNANNTITYTASITNQSTVNFDYTIRIAFKDGDTKVTTADATVSRLGGGKSVDFSATGTPPRSLVSSGACDVENVTAKPSA